MKVAAKKSSLIFSNILQILAHGKFDELCLKMSDQVLISCIWVILFISPL